MTAATEKCFQKEETVKRTQKEWRKMLEAYYETRLKNETLTPIEYLVVWNCQRSHQIRRCFIKKWKKLQIDGMLRHGRQLEDPNVKLQFDMMFPLSTL